MSPVLSRAFPAAVQTNMSDSQLGKFEFSDGRIAYCLLLPTKPNSLDIQVTVICGKEAWKGVLPEDELRKQASAVETDAEKFRKTALGALGLSSTASQSEKNDRETLQCEIANGHLTWKKSVADQGVRYKLGSMAIERQNPELAIDETLSALVATTTALRTELADVAAANSRLALERAGAVRRLEDFLRQRDEAESELFEKMAAVLNEKKTKIRSLKRELDRIGDTYRSDSPVYEKPASPALLRRQSEDGSSSSSSATDIDEDTKMAPKYESRQDNSLMLYDDEDDVIIPKKTRTRVRAPRYAAPVSPVPSTSSAASSFRPSRQLRRPQRNSKPIDADELLDEM